jgi:drug/metabolite transporter (DMT)-like permease
MDANKTPSVVTGALLALAATFIWSWNYIVARGVIENIPPVALSFFRWSTAFLFIIPFALKNLIREKEAVKANINYIIIMALLSVTMFNTLIYIAGHSTTAINLSLIAISTPVFIILISHYLLKEKTSAAGWIGVAVTITGVILLICRGSLSVLTTISFSAGDIWMTIAAAIFALYSILLRRKPSGIGRMTFLIATFGLGTAMLLPFFLIERYFQPVINFTPEVIVSILYTGIFASITAFFLWNRSVEIIGAAKAGIIYYTLPLFSSLWAFLLLGEDFLLIHLFSMILIIAGIIIATDIKKNFRL